MSTASIFFLTAILLSNFMIIRLTRQKEKRNQVIRYWLEGLTDEGLMQLLERLQKAFSRDFKLIYPYVAAELRRRKFIRDITASALGNQETKNA